MKINKTLKTFEDGSEMTVAGAAVTGLIAVAVGAVASGLTVAVGNWRYERWLRKRGLHQDQLNSKD